MGITTGRGGIGRRSRVLPLDKLSRSSPSTEGSNPSAPTIDAHEWDELMLWLYELYLAAQDRAIQSSESK
jgi:hypothetical protein